MTNRTPVDRHRTLRLLGALIPRSSGAARGKRRAFTGNYVASLPSVRPSNARDDQAELSKDYGGRRTLRSVAGGSWTLDHEQWLFRKQTVPQFWLCFPAQPRGDDRQSVGPRAAAA